MAGNQILTSSEISFEALMILENNLVFSRGMDRQYSDQFAVEGGKIGDTINIRRPARFVANSGPALQLQDFVETSLPLQLAYYENVHVPFTSKDLTLSMDDFSERVLKPAVATLANKIDYDGLVFAVNATPTSVGIPGTTPTSSQTYLNAGDKMNDEAAPRDSQRFLCVSSLAEATAVNSFQGLFQKADSIAKQYEMGRMGTAFGFDWSMSQNVPTHTVGALGGTPLVDGAAQTGNTLNTKGWSNSIAGILNVGDIFTIANVNAINPQNRQSTGKLRQFVVTASANSTGAGKSALSIYPAINPPGVNQTLTAFQTVDSAPIDGAALTVVGTAGQTSVENLAYHKSAYTMAMADLELPRNMEMAEVVRSKKAGLSIRFVRGFDIVNDRFISRLDALYGFAATYPEMGCRVKG